MLPHLETDTYQYDYMPDLVKTLTRNNGYVSLPVSPVLWRTASGQWRLCVCVIDRIGNTQWPTYHAPAPGVDATDTGYMTYDFPERISRTKQDNALRLARRIHTGQLTARDLANIRTSIY